MPEETEEIKEETTQNSSSPSTESTQTENPKPQNPQVKKINKIRLILSLVSLVIIAALSTTGFFYYQSQQELRMLQKDPKNAVSQEVQETINKVGTLIILPTSEEPQVATITDPEKLKDQPFFAIAQKDDKVLIYANAKKAILYRPSENKIVDIAPVNLGNQEPGKVAGESSRKLRFVILNGTNVSGLARKYQEEVTQKIQNSEVISVGDAKTKDVTKTFVVALQDLTTQNIEGSLGIESQNLPEGEQKPAADFLIVLGTDKAATQ